MNTKQLQGLGITCTNQQLLQDRAVTATGVRASAGKQGSAQGEHRSCHWHWDTLLLVASKHRGCKTGKDPAARVGFALHVFGGLELKYLEVGWGRSL